MPWQSLAQRYGVRKVDMKRRFFGIPVVIAMVAGVAACRPDTGPETQTTGTVSIGALIRELDVVEHGPSPDQMVPVEDSVTLNPGDSLRITQGGEGLLDFGGFLSLRVFNDTQLNEIIIESAANAPLIARLALERGGFTGNLIQQGSKAVFQTPGGAEITVLGTTFFIVYDATNGTTTVGNFDGSVGVISGGQIVSLNPGHFFGIPAGQPPGPEQAIPITLDQFNSAARELASPIEVVNTLLIEGQPPTIPASSVVVPTPTPPPAQTTIASPTLTHTPSVTPAPPTATNTQLACPPTITVDQPAFCREGPGTNYNAITGFEAETSLRVDGQSPFSPLWWWVEIPTGGHCWISDAVVTIEGDTDTSCVGVINPPPTYTPTSTPTETSTPKPPTDTPTVTPSCTPNQLGTPCP